MATNRLPSHALFSGLHGDEYLIPLDCVIAAWPGTEKGTTCVELCTERVFTILGTVEEFSEFFDCYDERKGPEAEPPAPKPKFRVIDKPA